MQNWSEKVIWEGKDHFMNALMCRCAIVLKTDPHLRYFHFAFFPFVGWKFWIVRWLRILPSVLFNMYASQQCLSRLKLPKISLQFWDLTLNLFALTFVLTQLLTCSPTMIRFVFSFLDNGLLLWTVSYIVLPRVFVIIEILIHQSRYRCFWRRVS